MSKPPSPEWRDKDDALGDIEGQMIQSLTDGELLINYEGGDAADASLGGGTKSFRVDKYLGGLISVVSKDLYPRIRNPSDFYRTAVTAFCLAWIRTRDSSALVPLRASIHAELIAMTHLTEEYARRVVVNQVKQLGTLIQQYRVEGDLDYAITLLRNWMRIIEEESDARFKLKCLNALRTSPEILDMVRDAQMRGIEGVAAIRTFLEKTGE